MNIYIGVQNDLKTLNFQRIVEFDYFVNVDQVLKRVNLLSHYFSNGVESLRTLRNDRKTLTQISNLFWNVNSKGEDVLFPICCVLRNHVIIK